MSFGWDGLLGGHGVQFRLSICKNKKLDTSRRRKGIRKSVEGKTGWSEGIHRCSKCVPLHRDEGSYVAAKPHCAMVDCASLQQAKIFGPSQAAAKCSSLLRTRGLA